jgi:hypothetical protein
MRYAQLMEWLFSQSHQYTCLEISSTQEQHFASKYRLFSTSRDFIIPVSENDTQYQYERLPTSFVIKERIKREEKYIYI